MGDRAPGSCIVYACPKGNESKVFEAITSYLTTTEWNDMTGQSDELKLNILYTDAEASLAFEDELAPELVKLGATFRIDAEGYMDYDPVVILHDPLLGTFKGSADHDGNPALDSLEIVTIIDSTSTRGELVEALLLRTGRAWSERFECLVKGFPPPTIEEMVAARNKLTKVEKELEERDAVSDA